jgi:hypothetical protein
MRYRVMVSFLVMVWCRAAPHGSRRMLVNVPSRLYFVINNACQIFNATWQNWHAKLLRFWNNRSAGFAMART